VCVDSVAVTSRNYNYKNGYIANKGRFQFRLRGKVGEKRHGVRQLCILSMGIKLAVVDSQNVNSHQQEMTAVKIGGVWVSGISTARNGRMSKFLKGPSPGGSIVGMLSGLSAAQDFRTLGLGIQDSGFDRSVGWPFPSLAPVRVKLMLLLFSPSHSVCVSLYHIYPGMAVSTIWHLA